MPAHEKIVLVTRKTIQEELVERFNTRAQAEFLLKQRGGSFDDIAAAHATYHQALETVKSAVPRGIRMQVIDRSYLPNFLFGPHDLVVTLGPDGLVVNTAKYLREQPLLAFNPDPQRMDGVLIPFPASQASATVPMALDGEMSTRLITMAVAKLDDGQSLYAVNDLFIGQRTHVSARYQLRYRQKQENQSSSGIIVSTGAGSTGWFRSIVTGASAVAVGFGDKSAKAIRDKYRFDPTAEELRFSVREPFASHVSSTDIVYGDIRLREQLEIVSQMPQGGVIFSDGIESDLLAFESGQSAKIGIAERKLKLLADDK